MIMGREYRRGDLVMTTNGEYRIVENAQHPFLKLRPNRWYWRAWARVKLELGLARVP